MAYCSGVKSSPAKASATTAVQICAKRRARARGARWMGVPPAQVTTGKRRSDLLADPGIGRVLILMIIKLIMNMIVNPCRRLSPRLSRQARTTSSSGWQLDLNVQVSVDLGALAGMEHDRRGFLLDDSRSFEPRTRTQRVAPEDRHACGLGCAEVGLPIRG